MSWKMTLIGGLAALGLGLTAVPATTTSAQAQVSYGYYPRGIPAYGGGYGYRPAPRAHWGGHRGYWGGHRGYYRGGYGGAHYGRPYRYGGYGYHRGWRGDRGAAVAAGVIGGLALGALVASPAYAHPAPVYHRRSAYYGRPVYYGHRNAAPYKRCWTERRVRINRYGERIIRRVRVCG